MKIDRRDFLRHAAGAIAAASSLPRSIERSADLGGDERRRVLVVLQLSGGNDGLNTVVPIEDDHYYRARPGLAIAKKDARRIDDLTGFHPSMRKLEAAYRDGRLAVVQSTGYPGANRSHFHSMDVWHTGDPSLTETRRGWLGRVLDADPRARGNPLFAIHIGDEAPRMLLSGTQRVTAFSSINDYGVQADRAAPNDRVKIERALERMMDTDTGGAPGGKRGIDAVRRTAAQALASGRHLKEAVGKSVTNAPYPGGALAQQLRLAGQVIGSDLPVSVVSLAFGGFDTHANQRGTHANLWSQIDDALAAFHDDLTQRGRSEDVLVFLYSEFGRRVAENGSGGTDHGAGAPAFFFGSPVKGGLHGKAPDLADLDAGDVRATTDFRRLYATILDRWLGVDSQAILGAPFDSVDVLRSGIKNS